MRALDSLRRFFRWRWFPFVVPLLLALLYVLLAVWLVPESFTSPNGDETASGQPSDQPTARKGMSSGPRASSTARSRRASSRVPAGLSGLQRPAADSTANDEGPGAEEESMAADQPSGAEPAAGDEDRPGPGEPE